MRLEKAIEILESFKPEAEYPPNPEAWDAFKLGIEALKAVLKRRKPGMYPLIGPLPGETKD